MPLPGPFLFRERSAMNLNFYTLCVIYLIYSFLGWVGETVVATAKGRRFTNCGVASGPFCFVYGTAGVLITKMCIRDSIRPKGPSTTRWSSGPRITVRSRYSLNLAALRSCPVSVSYTHLLLAYLQKKDIERYRALIATLGLRK